MSEKDFQRVDDDWKERAKSEREKLQEKIDDQLNDKEQAKLPPATFMSLVSTFATQAMIALGEIEIPGAEGRNLDLEGAKFAIDTLGVIQEKTKGNLSEEEKRALEDVLQSLRLRFVKKKQENGTESSQ